MGLRVIAPGAKRRQVASGVYEMESRGYKRRDNESDYTRCQEKKGRQWGGRWTRGDTRL